MSGNLTFPERTLRFTVKENEYKIDYPNTGQLIDIEVLKASISRETYGAIVSSNSDRSERARFLIDMIATFNTLCPDLKKDLKVNGITELKAEDSNTLLKVYIKEVLPWLVKWERALNSDFNDSEEDELKKA